MTRVAHDVLLSGGLEYAVFTNHACQLHNVALFATGLYLAALLAAVVSVAPAAG